MIMRLYVSLLEMYIVDNKFDEKLLETWSNEIRPFLMQKYPVTKQRYFNHNSDLHLLINLIDLEKEKIQNKKNEDKKIIIEKPNNNNSKKNNTDDIKTSIKIENVINNKNEIKEDLNNKNKDKKNNEEEDIKILREENKPKIIKFLKEVMKKQKIHQIKKTNSMKNLRPHSHTIASQTTCDDSNFEDTLNINQLIENKDIVKDSINKTYKKYISHTIYDEIIDFNGTEEEEEEKEEEKNFKRRRSNRGKTVVLLNEITPRYKEEEEINSFNIIYKEPEDKLCLILPDILLKKIIFDDFMNKNALLVYHFCQQCFCFINKEIFFRKLFNCYKFYKNKKIPLDNLKNLIDFINILIIELFEYDKKIDIKEINEFYNELINDLITNIIKEETYENKKEENYNNIEINKSNNNEEYENKIILNENENKDNNSINNNIRFNKRKDLINKDLNTDVNDVRIFITQEKYLKQNNENENQIKSNMINKNINKDNNNIIKGRNASKSICLKGNTLLSLFKQKKEDIKEKKEDILNNNKINEVKKEQKKLFKIQKTVRKSTILSNKYLMNHIINEEVGKEENSDEENKLNNSELINSSDSDSDSDIDSINEHIQKNNKKEEKEINEKIEIIDNLCQKYFGTKKFLTIKEEIFYKLQYILLLINSKNEEKHSFIDVKYIKLNFPFYDTIRNLIISKNNKSLIHSLSSRKLTKVGNIMNFSQLNKSDINISREYLKKGYFCITDWKTEEIGDKLYLVSKSFLNKINRKELYRACFLKKEKDITSPNVVACINNFNKLTFFIIEDIISYYNPKDRAKMYDKWVQVADYCKSNKDYNDCIAIYSALNYYIITRMKLTAKEIKSKTKHTFEQISIFCKCEGNYKKIREEMNLCEEKGLTFIPYLGMLLKDINFYEERSKYISDKGLINIEKIENINNLIEKYFRYKNSEKILNEKYKAINELKFFEKLENIKEEDLEKMSNDLEPESIYNTKKIKKLTQIDKSYFACYKVNTNNNNKFKRATICGKFKKGFE